MAKLFIDFFYLLNSAITDCLFTLESGRNSTPPGRVDLHHALCTQLCLLSPWTDESKGTGAGNMIGHMMFLWDFLFFFFFFSTEQHRSKLHLAADTLTKVLNLQGKRSVKVITFQANYILKKQANHSHFNHDGVSIIVYLLELLTSQEGRKTSNKTIILFSYRCDFNTHTAAIGVEIDKFFFINIHAIVDSAYQSNSLSILILIPE